MGELNLSCITPKALGELTMAVCSFCSGLLRSFCAHSFARSIYFSSAKLLVSYGAAEEKTCIAHYQLSELKFEFGLLVPQRNLDLLKKLCALHQTIPCGGGHHTKEVADTEHSPLWLQQQQHHPQHLLLCVDVM